MKTFPASLNVSNKDNFKKLNYERMKCYLRRDIYEHVISKEEKEYFDLDKFNLQRVENMEQVKTAVNELIPELQEIGWKCTISFGGTGLFIYKETKPSNCYD